MLSTKSKLLNSNIIYNKISLRLQIFVKNKAKKKQKEQHKGRIKAAFQRIFKRTLELLGAIKETSVPNEINQIVNWFEPQNPDITLIAYAF